MTPGRPTGQPVPLQAGLEAIVRSLHGTDAATVRSVFSDWEDAVGPLIAQNAKPIKLDRGVLLVEVVEPAWATQLRYLQDDLLVRLRQYGGSIERIEVKVAGKARSNRPVKDRRNDR